MLPEIGFTPAHHTDKLVYKTQNPLVSHNAQKFLICCMDFRLCDDIVKFMNEKGWNNNYDQFVLAGASLGFTQTRYP